MRRFFVVVMICTACLSARAQVVESEITVLGVTLPGANFTKATQYLADLADPVYWTSADNPVGVTVKLANSGLPIPMPQPAFGNGTGFYFLQLAYAKGDAVTHGIRNDADVIMFFTGPTDGTACGFALQENWTVLGGEPQSERWNPDPLDFYLDLNGKDDSYAAITGTTGVCGTADYNEVAIHEFGHLLGAGHVEDLPPPYLNSYLFEDSYAMVYEVIDQTARSIMTNPTEGDFLVPMWSRNAVPPWHFSALTNNLETVVTTALSVANYRRANPTPPEPPVPPPELPPPPLPPGCGLSPPVGLTSVLVGVCDPFPYTHYALFWGDVCPTATAHYEIEESLPLGAPYVFGTATVAPWAEAFITGAVPAGLRVRACNGGICSAPSNETVIVPNC